MRLLISCLALIITNYISAQEWTPVSAMPFEFQTHHSFGFALDGMGYVVSGGSDFGERGEFYQYDPTFDWWIQLDDFPGSARGFAIGDIWDGKAYFGFGYDGNTDLNDLWVFDPETMEWDQLADCPCEPRTHPAFVAHNDKIYVGLGSGSGNLNDWWEYDMATDAWEQKPSFPGLPRHHPYQFGIGDFIYTGFGHGNDFISKEWYRYNPSTEEWLQVASIPGEGRVAGTQFSYNGKGYILSGDGDNHSFMLTGEFWSYDPAFDWWEQLTPHPEKSRWAPASFVLNGEVYIINGTTFTSGQGDEYIRPVYKYSLDPVSTDDTFEKSGLILYPNPAADQINLDVDLSSFKDFKVNIYNVKGQKVYTTSNQSLQLDLSNLESGNYLLTLNNDGKNYRQKFIKH